MLTTPRASPPTSPARGPDPGRAARVTLTGIDDLALGRARGHRGSRRADPRRTVLPGLLLAVSLVLALAAGVAPAPAEARDLLILRSELRRGELLSCDAAACRLDGSTIPRRDIVGLGLGDPPLPPPAVRNPGQDELHLRDGSVRPGPLVSLDARRVVTPARAYERREVRWIYLARPCPPRVLVAAAAVAAGVARAPLAEAAARMGPAYSGSAPWAGMGCCAHYLPATRRPRPFERFTRFACASAGTPRHRRRCTSEDWTCGAGRWTSRPTTPPCESASAEHCRALAATGWPARGRVISVKGGAGVFSWRSRPV
jgi:hypothetical protein